MILHELDDRVRYPALRNPAAYLKGGSDEGTSGRGRGDCRRADAGRGSYPADPRLLGGRPLGATSSNPRYGTPGTPLTDAPKEATGDGEAAPSDWRYWFMRAHVAWARKYAPHLLEEWHV